MRAHTPEAEPHAVPHVRRTSCLLTHLRYSRFEFEGSETHGFLIRTHGFLLRSYDLESERRESTPPIFEIVRTHGFLLNLKKKNEPFKCCKNLT